jgi:hypothetical protein
MMMLLCHAGSYPRRQSDLAFIDSYAFESTELKLISLEVGHDLLYAEHGFLIDITHHKMTHYSSVS